ncbi:MAG: hypothetical protein R3C32_08595 [Chloroflexota bacterium]
MTRLEPLVPPLTSGIWTVSRGIAAMATRPFLAMFITMTVSVRSDLAPLR